MATICALSRAMKCPEMAAEPVGLIGADMVEFVDRDQAIVECLDTELVDREANVAWVQTSTRSGLAKNSPTALTLDLATRPSSAPGALQRFHLRLDLPVGPKAELRQWLVGETAADGAFRHDNEAFLMP